VPEAADFGILSVVRGEVRDYVMSKSPSPYGGDGRDARGRFTKGNPGGPGCPYARRVAELRSALLAAVDSEAIADVGRKLVEKARAGDLAAAKLLLSYTVGAPQQTVPVDPDRVQINALRLADEFQQREERAALMSELGL
jgi:hypothetical protein